jgi:hypothetical protein
MVVDLLKKCHAAEHYPDHPADRHRQAARRPTGCCLAAIGALLLLLGVVLLLKQRARSAAVPVVTIAATRQPTSAAAVTTAAVTAGEAMSHPDHSCQWANPGTTPLHMDSGTSRLIFTILHLQLSCAAWSRGQCQG